MPSYVTPDDMIALYDDSLLIQATNYSDRTANEIDMTMLSKACEAGDRIVNGYLLGLAIPLDKLKADFRAALTTHAARLAMDFLASTDPQIREHAKETIEWLKGLSRLSSDALENLIEPGGEVPGVSPILPVVEFDEGRRWRVTF